MKRAIFWLVLYLAAVEVTCMALSKMIERDEKLYLDGTDELRATICRYSHCIPGAKWWFDGKMWWIKRIESAQPPQEKGGRG